MKLDFGFYPRSIDIKSGSLNITTLPGLDAKVESVASDDSVEGDWIYSPSQQVAHLGGGVRQRPYPSRVFGLPATHRIEQRAASATPDELVFYIWMLSFFTGMRLTSTEAGFLDATPIKPGRLVDFVLRQHDLAPPLELARAFWQANSAEPRRPRVIAASVHALFLGQNPIALQFERFLSLYTAFDACFALAKMTHQPRGRVTHSERVAWMCELFGIEVPAWADPHGIGPAVALLRNETVHEALFMGEPLGFAVHNGSNGSYLTLEMQALISRLIVALLGADHADYVRSPINTRQRHMLGIGSSRA